ncbi:MAG TPA: beta-ketoacyl-[acyl-carrier-protein] synthase family protein [Steroidobacteraceae bacterium]|nr:beta-ketoacyl-[acyl-carrier-protein] synthase family protein [Steroidobacteraceae bacterium]HRX89682.1 beta-ketoacyl-[acyl-carrier-protein] synthase family protein [Steroidobacteraceae bacterium]
MTPLTVTAWTATSAAGAGRGELLAALRTRTSGLRPNDFGPAPLTTWIGRVAGVEDCVLPAALQRWECRNNRLAWLGLQADGFLTQAAAARDRYGADRVALVVGTSTSSIGASEEAYARLDSQGQFPVDLQRPVVHTPHSLGDFLQHALGLTGFALTVATACSSSAKVFAQAERLIAAGIADAAIVGGVDSLCGSVLFGFNSLELISRDKCRPFDPERRGINIGEAAGFALLEKRGDGPRLIGFGESSDAHHMSSPHPQGRGARAALEAALERASLPASAVGYINLHGTSSQKNDEIEARVVAQLFPEATHASSTKGWTGHTLGAAGILEAVITLLALETGLLPGTLNTESLDGDCGPQIRLGNADSAVDYALSNSFGFGGSNCVLAFGARHTH